MKVLFLCVQNSARSQIAEAVARHLCGAKVDVASAGSQPANEVHPMALRVLQESGISIQGLHPKKISDLPQSFMDSVDLVITLCRDEVCPVIPTQAKKISWAFHDPSEVPEQSRKFAFEQIKESIIEKIMEFKEQEQIPFC